MKSKKRYTSNEAKQIRSLLLEKPRADRDGQKRIRDKLRDLEFFIKDFDLGSDGFRAKDFDAIIAAGTIEVVD